MNPYRSIAVVALLLFAACGGSSGFDSTEGAPGSVPLSDLPAELASAQCDIARRCLAPVFHIFFGQEDCETRVEEQVRQGGFGALEAAVEAGRVTYDAEAAADCLEIVATRDCAEANQRTIDACEAALGGTVAPGGDCEIDEECAGSRICEVASACPGTCVDRYGAGQACTDNDQCADGLVCSEATMRCIAPAEDGAACGGGVEPQCDGGLLCEGEDEDAGMTGTCSPLGEIEERTAGQACSPSVGNLCEEGLSCALDALAPELGFSCRAMPASGGPCRIGFPENCPRGEYCPLTIEELALGTFDSECAPLPGDGEPCAVRPENVGPVCAAYTRCDAPTGTCLALRDLGETCSSDELCHSGSCDNGGCAPNRACQ